MNDVTQGTFGNAKKLLNTKEAAEYLGIKVQTVYNMRHQRRGPDYVMVGGKPMYEPDAIARYLDENRVCLSAWAPKPRRFST